MYAKRTPGSRIATLLQRNLMNKNIKTFASAKSNEIPCSTTFRDSVTVAYIIQTLFATLPATAHSPLTPSHHPPLHNQFKKESRNIVAFFTTVRKVEQKLSHKKVGRTLLCQDAYSFPQYFYPVSVRSTRDCRDCRLCLAPGPRWWVPDHSILRTFL